MAENYYSSTDEEPAADSTPSTDSEMSDEMSTSDDEDKDEESEPTALIPKTLSGGKTFKVGDEIVLKIVHEYEDEFEVEYAHDEPEKETKPKSTMEESQEGIDKMANPGNPGMGY